MAVHIEEMTSEVHVVDGDLPLSQAQISRLVKLVMDEMKKKQKDEQSHKEATSLQRSATPPGPVAE